MPTALIAEDEPLLAAALQAELARLWPELRITARVADGLSAVREALALQPQLCFLDIRMPGATGLRPRRHWPRTGPRARPSRCWCLSPPTTSTRSKPLMPKPWTTCSSR